jgi:hypothetical protein
MLLRWENCRKNNTHIGGKAGDKALLAAVLALPAMTLRRMADELYALGYMTVNNKPLAISHIRYLRGKKNVEKCLTSCSICRIT